MSEIRFCPQCDNNFSNFQIKKTENGSYKLLYKCNSCLTTEEVSNIDKINQATIYKKGNLQRKPDRPIHSSLCDDPTLPRTSTIDCPRKECPSNDKGKEPEVVMIDYNEDRRVAYICCECKYSWRSE